jgi:ribonuclease P protein component
VSLPQQHRLRRRQDFQEVYQRGKRRYGTYLTIVSLYHQPSDRSPDLPVSRFGISIGHKFSKKAVVRNLLKRRIKASIRQLLPQIVGGWTVVIGVKSTAHQCEYVEILRELKQLLTLAEVIDGH